MCVELYDIISDGLNRVWNFRITELSPFIFTLQKSIREKARAFLIDIREGGCTQHYLKKSKLSYVIHS